MKCMRVVLLGVFIIMLCVMPAMAEKPGDMEEDLLVQGPDAAGSVPSEGPAHTVITPAGPVYGSIDTQSPVLDGGAFTNYDTVFVHGVNAENYVPNPDVERVELLERGVYTRLNPKTSTYYPQTGIFCPIPSYQLKTGGVQPKVRYLAVQHYSLGVSGSKAWPEVYYVGVYNGYTQVDSFSMTFSSTSPTTQIINLGEWYTFDRGLNLVLYIRNGMDAPSSFAVCGYGARFEW